MDENNKDNINSNEETNENPKVDENQSQGESSYTENNSFETSNENQEEIQPKIEENNNHEVIHKKEGRLHIYVRQDKYKGELKSKNFVGRLYFDGKQKISSSGTPNLEEAIPILEKWFDDIYGESKKEEEVHQEVIEKVNEEPSALPEQTEPVAALEKVSTSVENENVSESKINLSILEKFKNINLKKISFDKKDLTNKISALAKNNYVGKVESFFKARLGKKSAQGEEILGIELTNKEIRLAQISTNKENQWVLDKFFIHPINLPDETSVLENADHVSNELTVAIQKAKIVTTNAAIAIPVTSAIIRVVTAPLMTEEELAKAIDTNSLWENLVQLTDNLDDYSIFHQVINRNQKENTMDILFVASKLSDINNYTSIIKNSGLNPVIIDVKCFALKSAVDQINQISLSTEDANLTAVLEFGLDENYVMILYDNNPIITDIFLRGQDRKILLESGTHEESEALSRRFIAQVKQAIQDFETKYEKRIRNIKVVSDLPNVDLFLGIFRKDLINVGFKLFDPLEGLKVPQQLHQAISLKNRSYLSTVIGLAFRKLDVFGYYKFVTAVKNINLLPNRKSVIKEKKIKALSNFAFKGVVGGVIGIYAILFTLSFWNIHSYNKKLNNYENVLSTHAVKTKEKTKSTKELGLIVKTLKLSKSLKSNKEMSYRVLAQIASSVPNRVKFESVDYNGKSQVIIQGVAASDQDILRLIGNLSSKKLIQQASLTSMQLPNSSNKTGQASKGFKIFVKIKKG
jgi:type IV pilus assembly protein PilN|tara:strand:+ start:480 stop:2723 length:2244 start_codon:yes stop_codon:yes gene_type:complete